MITSIKFLVTLFLLSFASLTFAQVAPKPPADTTREFEIIKGPSMRAIKIDSVTTLQTIAGGAVVKQGTTIFHSDSLVINPVTHILEAFGNVVINQADTVHTYAQYLKYLGIEKTAYLKKDVKLTDKKGTLFTQDLDYNLQTGIGNFHNGGKVIEGKNVITSVDGTYYADTKDIYFKKNVKVDGPKNHIRADSLLYNMQTKKSTFISSTHIKNDEVDINTSQGTYDLTTGDAFFTSRTTVKDSSGRVYTADNMALENKSGNAQLEGNAVIVDTSNHFIVTGNQIFMNKKNNSFLATRKPVLIIKQKNDSTYIAADTIFSGITTIVEQQKELLQKDSAVNINLQQNEKISDLKKTDTAHRNFILPEERKVDSSRKLIDSSKIIPVGKDSTQNPFPEFKREKSKKEVTHPPQRDSLMIHENKSNSILKSDSVEKDANKIILPEFTREKPKKEVTHPVEKDSLLIHQNKSDSTSIDSTSVPVANNIPGINSMSKKIKDSTAKADSAVRYFLAFHHVRIFNDSLQSISDSMFFSTKDSVFRLYYDPILWSGQTQITGDTIFLFTKNKQPERLYGFERGMIVNKTREGFYNQMSGKTINGYFKDSKIDYLRVKGSQAESIYYMQDDDSAYIGMNRTTADVIDLYFKNEDLKKVLFVNEIKGKMFPMNQIPDDQRELKGFKWMDAKRPKNKLELFE